MKALEWQDDEGNDRRLGVYEDSFLLEIWGRKTVTQYRISYNLLRKIVEWGAAAIFEHERNRPRKFREEMPSGPFIVAGHRYTFVAPAIGDGVLLRTAGEWTACTLDTEWTPAEEGNQ